MKKYYLSIYNVDYQKILERLKKSFQNGKKEFIITANAEIFIKALTNPELDEMLTNKNNIVIADGVSIIKTAKYFNIDLNNKIAGVELCQDLIDYASTKNYSIYIYGCKEEVLNILKDKYPKTNFIKLRNGYDYNEEEVLQEIKSIKPDLIIAALGVPRQEIFLNKVSKEIDKGIMIGVGGSIDVISGYKKRAPLFFRKHNIEWLYRILKEPKRLKRFCEHNIKLLFVAKKNSKLENKKKSNH